MALDLLRLSNVIKEVVPFRYLGKVVKSFGLIVEGDGPMACLGDLCYLEKNGSKIPAEVVGFRDKRVILMPIGDVRGIKPGARIERSNYRNLFPVGENLLGRVINGMGVPIDGGPPIVCDEYYPIYHIPINPLERSLIKEPLELGIRSIDGLITCGKGQRMGIFAGSGVGKSVLMGMIARNTEAPVNVIALIGERGREVKEFIKRDLGDEGLKKSVVVVVTSDEPAVLRVRGAYVATTIAEFFRDKGKDVLLMMDSLTRFAMAQREIGLSVGEPPTTKGYPPSFFASLPKLLERAGTAKNGASITGLYTVLVEGDDFDEPVADAARSVLDGHIVLSRELADQGQYPAVDVLKSVSRVMKDVVSNEHKTLAKKFCEVLSTYKRSEDLINIGAYVSGTNPKIDYAISHIEDMRRFLMQDIGEKSKMSETLDMLKRIFK